ncbi:CPBP family intramembrane glutamic endopeptidase [Persicirhabdus sediminis]|uniref:CPBP family intramembrane metalloprotease n=1 Tax=Persicirhabdus sediminis TaxID=454144 RepID=A0A8J7MDB5_9BACT|nr:CPBP family intramembrane glutamic endopeptidase [Persicirhabdus sediminis]MBK1790992.1 CPBP family intramembrane metalloprotease [Persicirhabdus sediminis]
MDPLQLTILTYFFIITLAVLIIGLLTYGIIRVNFPNTLPTQSGRVNIDKLNFADLIGMGMFIALFVAALYSAYQTDPTKAKPDITISHLLSGVIVQFFMVALCIGMVFMRVNPAKFLGLKWSSWKRDIWVIPAGIIICYVLIIAINQVTGYHLWISKLLGEENMQQDVVKMLRESEDPKLLIAMAIGATVIAPICEEIVFRGYIYASIKRFSDRYFAAILSSLIFAFVHLHVAPLLPLTVLAIILCIAYERSGSIWAPIGIHAIFNSITVGAILFTEHIPS